jgi:hypothetical protein
MLLTSDRVILVQCMGITEDINLWLGYRIETSQGRDITESLLIFDEALVSAMRVTACHKP